MQYEIKVKKNLNEVNIESDVIKKISKERFFVEMHDQNIDIKLLMRTYKEDLNATGKFNFFLRMVKQNFHINLYESMLFLEEEGHKPKNIFALFTSDNKHALKMEFVEKFKTSKIEPSILEKFIIE